MNIELSPEFTATLTVAVYAALLVVCTVIDKIKGNVGREDEDGRDDSMAV